MHPLAGAKPVVRDTARPKAPGLVYGSASLALLLLVSVIALTARQPPPPAIAELAPQAVEQIRDAPSEQSSEFGGAEGGGGGGGASPTTTSTTAVPVGSPKPIDVPRVRRCIGDPPRQIEDPQSPPCVPYWDGDNGGSTWRGVTRDEIRVVVPRYDQMPAEILEAFFNRRFEFYGRKLVFIDTSSERGETDAAKQSAAAVSADTTHQAFASLDADDGYHYYRELARRNIVSVVGQPLFTEQQLRSLSPYVWQYPLGVDEMLADTGEWICARLAGRKAIHAGTDGINDLRRADRKFGVILYNEFPDQKSVGLAELEEELRSCGAEIAVRAEGDDFFSAEQAQDAVLRMQSAGVTTILCLCHTIQTGMAFRGASRQAYQPEWILSSYLMQDHNGAMQTFASQPEQLQHSFGTTFTPRQLKQSDSPVIQAVREEDPQNRTTYTSLDFFFLQFRYRALLLLASGIQMAGPNLTPESFARGLQNAQFPNPNTFHRAGAVSFLDGDHSMTEDAAEWWWSNSDRGPYGGTGTICYVDGGARRKRGEWHASTSALFNGPCDSGA